MNPAIVAKLKGFVERDFSEAPSFTQPLADHTTTSGYSTQLSCSVRASPKVRGGWAVPWAEDKQGGGAKESKQHLCQGLWVAWESQPSPHRPSPL